jgi:hypothetical protein
LTSGGGKPTSDRRRPPTADRRPPEISRNFRKFPGKADLLKLMCLGSSRSAPLLMPSAQLSCFDTTTGWWAECLEVGFVVGRRLIEGGAVPCLSPVVTDFPEISRKFEGLRLELVSRNLTLVQQKDGPKPSFNGLTQRLTCVSPASHRRRVHAPLKGTARHCIDRSTHLFLPRGGWQFCRAVACGHRDGYCKTVSVGTPTRV